MADEEKKKEETEPPKKSKKRLFVIVGVVLVAVLGTAGFFMMTGDEPAPAETAEAAAPAAVSIGLVPLDTFLVNLSGQDSERYMKLTLRLSVTPQSTADAIKEDELLLARVRDRILTTLMFQTAEDLEDPLGKEGLRREIQVQIGTLLVDGQVQDVLFSEFVVQ